MICEDKGRGCLGVGENQTEMLYFYFTEPYPTSLGQESTLERRTTAHPFMSNFFGFSF